MASVPPARPLPLPPHEPALESLIIFIHNGNPAALQTMIEHPHNKAYFDTSHGRALMRFLASLAASTGLCTLPLRGVWGAGECCAGGGGGLASGWNANNYQPNDAVEWRHLLSLPGQELDLNRSLGIDATLLHVCAKLGFTRVAKELVQRGADMDVMDSDHHTPLCTAASNAQLPLVRYFLQQYLQQYQRRGKSEPERALSHPCGRERTEYSLLGHVVKGCFGDSEPHVAMARYLVQECGVDVRQPFKVICEDIFNVGDNQIALQFMPVHVAAMRGSCELVGYFIDECGVPIDIQSPAHHFTPLHAASLYSLEEAVLLPLVRFLVEEKGADVTLKTVQGKTAADIALGLGKRQIYEIVTRKKEEVAARQAAEALAAARLAEETRAADSAAQALMEELAAEKEAEEGTKQAKKGKKFKAKNKRTQEGKGGSAGGGGGGGSGAASAAAAAAVGPSVASLTAATGSLSGGEDKEEKAQEKNSEENSLLEAKSPALAAAKDAPPSSLPLGNDNDEEEAEDDEEDDVEAFQAFLLDDAPLSYHCSIGICLLMDPINAADGHTYQRAELERWIETCRVKQQSLTSPMTFAHDQGTHGLDILPRALDQMAGGRIHRAAAAGMGGEVWEEKGREMSEVCRGVQAGEG